MSTRRGLRAVYLALAGTCLASAALTQSPPADAPQASEAPPVRLERIVAVVDDDPIFLSDLDRAERWAPPPAPSRDQLLNALIDERVRIHEVDRRGGAPARAEDVAQQLDSAPPTLDREVLEPIVRRQLRVLAHVEERLGALVFVSDEAIRAYYDGTLREEMLRQGEALPPFDDVRDPIRALLREEALERRIATWTDELRAEADIQNWLHEPLPLESLPEPSLRLTAPPPQPELPEDPDGHLHPDRP